MFEMFDLTALALIIAAIVATPWTLGSAVGMLLTGRRGRGLLLAGLALFCGALAVYLGFLLSSILVLPESIPKLPFLWDILLNSL
jgi:hypothetical protein